MPSRILFINGHLNSGGVERSLVDVLQHIDYSRYEVDLLLLQGMGDYAYEIPKEVKVHAYDTTDAYGPLVSTSIKNLIRGHWFLLLYRLIIQFFGLSQLRFVIPVLRKRFDSAIAYRVGPCTDLLVEAVDSPNKISWWHHGEMNLSESEQRKLGVNYQTIQHVVAVSESCAKLVRQSFESAKDKVCVIPNMLCAETILVKTKAQTISLFHSGNNTLKIVSVGRLSPEKNMVMCVQVADELQRRGISFEWVLVGDGEERVNIEKSIQQARLSSHIRMTGTLDNPYPVMKDADVLFHPSLVESQGLTVLEAMALGTPVVCVSSAGTREFILHGKNGLLIENDVTQAADAILQLSDDINLRLFLSEEAFKTVTCFAPSQIVEQIEQFI